MIQNEIDIIQYMNLPSIPRKVWDGRASFKDGVAIVSLYGNEEAYAVATYDAEHDAQPRIKKTFALSPFSGIAKDEEGRLRIYPVPSYMDDDVAHFDLDEKSMAAAQSLIDEAHELETEGTNAEVPLPDNEYFFAHIHNDDEARAFIKSYNKTNRVKGRVPIDHETIVMKLSVMWAEVNKKQNKNKKRF